MGLLSTCLRFSVHNVIGTVDHSFYSTRTISERAYSGEGNFTRKLGVVIHEDGDQTSQLLIAAAGQNLKVKGHV